MAELQPLPLPAGVKSAYVDCTSTCGLKFHTLQSGSPGNKALVLLVHGYPELGYSWRKVMPALEGAGYFVVAPDQRGHGRTTGWDTRPYDEVDLTQFRLTQLVRDMVSLAGTLGYTEVKSIVGHDFGGVTAAICALMRPDFFKACVTMSHPFKGSPKLPCQKDTGPYHDPDIHTSLAKLDTPRKHYKWDNSKPSAAEEWYNPPQGLTAFLRGYVHLKSAKYGANKPFPLQSWTAEELAKMPHYYIMPLNKSMPQTVADDMKGEDENATKSFMNDEELGTYVQEWKRIGFQGGLNWYRSTTDPDNNSEMFLFAGKKIEVPMMFMSGQQDWGNYQEPGALESYPKNCTDFRGIKQIREAGHWPQQEQPAAVAEELLDFLQGV